MRKVTSVIENEPADMMIYTDAACKGDVAAAATYNYITGETRTVIKKHTTTLDAELRALLQAIGWAGQGIRTMRIYADCAEAVEECRMTMTSLDIVSNNHRRAREAAYT